MKHTDLNKGSISNFLDKYLTNVKIIKARTLFPAEPNWRMITTDNCPFCGRRIYIVMKTGVRYCKNKKCPTDTKFIMKEKEYRTLKGKILESEHKT